MARRRRVVLMCCGTKKGCLTQSMSDAAHTFWISALPLVSVNGSEGFLLVLFISPHAHGHGCCKFMAWHALRLIACELDLTTLVKGCESILVWLVIPLDILYCEYGRAAVAAKAQRLGRPNSSANGRKLVSCHPTALHIGWDFFHVWAALQVLLKY